MNNTDKTIKITSRITENVVKSVNSCFKRDPTEAVQEAVDNLVAVLAVLMLTVEMDQIDSVIDAAWYQAERIVDQVNNEPTV